MGTSRRTLLKAMGGSAAFALGGFPAIVRAATTYNWRFAHVGAIGSDQDEFAKKFIELIGQKTGGAVKVTNHPAGQMGGEQDLFQQVRGQALEFCLQGLPGVANLGAKEAMLLDLPYVITDRDHGWRLVSGDFGNWMKKTVEEKTGNRPLSYLDNGFRHVFNRRGPVEKPEDLVGLKLRSLQAPGYVAVYKHLRAVPIPMAFPEVYSALETGVIDGAEVSAKQYVQERFYEVAKNFSLTSINYNTVMFFTNAKFLDSQPAEIKQAVTEAAAETSAYHSTLSRKMEDDMMAKVKESGINVITPNLDPFVAAVKPAVWDLIEAQIPDGKENVAMLLKAIDATK